MKFRSICILVIASTTFISPPSFAQSPPRYDPDAYCKGVAQFAGGSAVIYSGCIEGEQDAYNNLKESWPTLPASVRAHCNDVARFAGGSYTILEGCVDLELDAAGNPKKFKF